MQYCRPKYYEYWEYEQYRRPEYWEHGENNEQQEELRVSTGSVHRHTFMEEVVTSNLLLALSATRSRLWLRVEAGNIRTN